MVWNKKKIQKGGKSRRKQRVSANGFKKLDQKRFISKGAKFFLRGRIFCQSGWNILKRVGKTAVVPREKMYT